MSDQRGDHSPFRLRVRYDPTVNAGHVLTMLTVVMSVVVWGLRLEGRVDGEEAARKSFVEQYQRDLSRNDRALDELKTMTRRIEDKVDSVRFERRLSPQQP